MGIQTGIAWTDHTYNPWYGCTHVSAGCDNCYMFAEQRRYGNDPEIVKRARPATFNAPRKWKSGRVFTCSWSDFFISDADEWRADAWKIIRETPWLTYQILTKRPVLIKSRLPADWGDGYPNVWLGVSVENQETADARIPILLQTPASVRFLSVEPLLESVELEYPLGLIKTAKGYFPCPMFDSSDGRSVGGGTMKYLGDAKFAIDWVIVGGESGPGARPCDVEWIRGIVAQCRSASLPVFVKQLGKDWRFEDEMPNGATRYPRFKRTDRKGGDPSEWPEDLRIREFPA